MEENVFVTYKSTVKCAYCNTKRNCLVSCQRYLEITAKLKVLQEKKGKKAKLKTVGQMQITVYDRNLYPNMLEMYGFNQVTVCALDEIKNFAKHDQVAVIETLYINKKYRKKGAGSLLMKEVHEYLFGILRVPITLLLAAPFGRAVTVAEIDDYIEFLISFYQKFGYTEFLDNFMLCTQKRYQFLRQKRSS